MHQLSAAALAAEALSITVVIGGFLEHAFPLVATVLACAWYLTNLLDWWRNHKERP